MANLKETATWEAGIYQFETSDPVMGGENGIDNKPTRQLANRTSWLKTELAQAVQSIGTNLQTAEQKYALKTTTLTAGAGLVGGGVLRDNMTLSLGTPSKITATTTNSAVSNTHTHEIDKASVTVMGIVKLSSATNSDAETLAATPKAVKSAYDRAAQSAPSGAVAFFAGANAPTGWLKANGAAVSRTTYAALFAAIGTTFGAGDGSTTFNLPDLRGEFPRFWDDGRGLDSGRGLGTQQMDAFQGHNRDLRRSQNNSYIHGWVGVSAGAGHYVPDAQGSGDVWITRDYLTDSRYGTPRVAAETRPRNIALLACIKI